jgi:hypothetical protein
MRAYKTKEFARLARKGGVDDPSLRQAIARAETGLIDATIGKFLIKLRVARQNEGRSGGFRTIAFHRQGDRVVFLHLFAKNAQGNLTNAELAAYREFAKHLAALTAEQISKLIEQKKWIEIGNEHD